MVTPVSERLEHYLMKTRIPLRLACITANDWPLVVSLWYLFADGQLYCATQATAVVAQTLQKNGRCAFEIAADQPPYCGVRGQGIATIDPATGLDTLRRLLDRYDFGSTSPLGQKLLSRTTPEVTIIIEPQSWVTWNFTKRMASSLTATPPEKICP